MSLLPVPLTIKELPVAVAWLPIATLLVPLAFVMDPTPPSENARLLLLPASPIHRLSLPPLDVPLKFKLLFVIFDPTPLTETALPFDVDVVPILNPRKLLTLPPPCTVIVRATLPVPKAMSPRAFLLAPIGRASVAPVEPVASMSTLRSIATVSTTTSVVSGPSVSVPPVTVAVPVKSLVPVKAVLSVRDRRPKPVLVSPTLPIRGTLRVACWPVATAIVAAFVSVSLLVRLPTSLTPVTLKLRSVAEIFAEFSVMVPAAGPVKLAALPLTHAEPAQLKEVVSQRPLPAGVSGGFSRAATAPLSHVKVAADTQTGMVTIMHHPAKVKKTRMVPAV